MFVKKIKFAFWALSFVSLFSTVAFAKQYNVLAVRVDFPYEDPDHETTSGRGVFDLRNYYDKTNTELRQDYYNPWDVPPHNRHYFELHLKALRNYWNTVTDNNIDINFQVWPQDSDSAYTMSRKFYKYGNGRSDEETYRKLTELLKEALVACKNAEGDKIDFSKYDTFMVIHAGIGKETSDGLNDMPSAFVSEKDIETYISSDFKIDGKSIDNGIIVPEMVAANGIGGLNGIMAQMFGHRIGLPSMSNNKDGMPAAGGWSLMDTGAMSYGFGTRGFIPTQPDIWSKIEIGKLISEPWIKTVTVNSDTTLDITATHINSGMTRAIKIPINDDEYLLIENRRRYASREIRPPAKFSDDPDTLSQITSGKDTTGVWIKPEHYDSNIPGSGILIWHINDKIISENRENNAVNNDSYRRGIDLLEADGIQDIGALLGLGDERAEFSEGYEGDTYKSTGRYIISPTTSPNTGSMWGANSGITIRINSPVSDTMNVTISFTNDFKERSLSIGRLNNISAADFTGNGIDDVLISGNDSIKIVSCDGKNLLSLPFSAHPSAFYDKISGRYNLAVSLTDSTGKYNGLKIFNYNGTSFEQSDVFNIGSGSNIASSGICTAFEKNGSYYILQDELSEASIGAVNLRNLSIFNTANLTTPEIVYNLPTSSKIRSIAATSTQIALVCENDSLYYLNSGSTKFNAVYLGSDISTDPLLIDIDRDNNYEIIIANGKKLFSIDINGNIKNIELADRILNGIISSDIDKDGYPEIILASGKHIFAYRDGFVPADNFPLDIMPGNENELITSGPVLCDFTQDNIPEIIFPTSAFRIIAYDTKGKIVSGFPLSIKESVSKPLFIYTYAYEDSLAIGYLSDTGKIYTRHFERKISDNLRSWPMSKGGPELNPVFFNSKISGNVKTSGEFKAYCYPNPITKGQARIRITPSSATYCNITIYSADGIKLFEKHLAENEILPGVANEIVLDASEYASGLYIAKIETRQKTAFCKIGVIK